MVAIHSYIQNEVPPLTPMSLIYEAKKGFANLTHTHIPVEENGLLIGNMSEDDVQGFDDDKKVEDYRYLFAVFFVRNDTNWLDVLEAFAKNNANVMPVLDQNNAYLGYYELIDIITLFKETPFLYEPGGILIVEKGNKDYSFSEISQIVEANKGKLLGAFISGNRDSIVQLTLKIGNIGLNDVIQSFRRYNYTIISGNEDDMYVEDLKQRSDYLKRFLDI